MKLALYSTFKHRIVAAALAGSLLASGAGSAFAVEESAVTITGGSLSSGAMTFGDFTPITLSGAQNTGTATWSIPTVTDARGTGAGWKVSLTLLPLREWAGAAYIASGKELASSSVKVTTLPVVTLADGTSSPANTVTPVSTTTALDTSSPVKLMSAALDGGMGSYAVSTLAVTLTVPASVHALTYKTDATVSLSTGP